MSDNSQNQFNSTRMDEARRGFTVTADNYLGAGGGRAMSVEEDTRAEIPDELAPEEAFDIEFHQQFLVPEPMQHHGAFWQDNFMGAFPAARMTADPEVFYEDVPIQQDYQEQAFQDLQMQWELPPPAHPLHFLHEPVQWVNGPNAMMHDVPQMQPPQAYHPPVQQQQAFPPIVGIPPAIQHQVHAQWHQNPAPLGLVPMHMEQVPANWAENGVNNLQVLPPNEQDEPNWNLVTIDEIMAWGGNLDKVT